MSANEISKMNDKQLRNEVQRLRDELAIFKRKYEDIIYNLDGDNFSSNFLAEQGNMKAKLEVTAEAIKAMVTDTDLKSAMESYLEITAGSITAAVKEVNDNLTENYSTTEAVRTMTSKSITDTVTAEYIGTKIGDTYVDKASLTSTLQTTAEGIFATVSAEYETIDNANAAYDGLASSIASVSLTAEGLTSQVTDLETFQTSTFSQVSGGFVLDGAKTKITGNLEFTDNSGVGRFSISHDESQDYGAFVSLTTTTAAKEPISIGYAGNVYIGGLADGNQVATRDWVSKNAGSGGSGVAKFG